MEKIEEGGGEAEEEEAGVNGGAEEEMALGVAAVVALKGEGLEEEMIEAEEVLIEARGGVEDLGATGIWIVKRTEEQEERAVEVERDIEQGKEEGGEEVDGRGMVKAGSQRWSEWTSRIREAAVERNDATQMTRK